MLSALLEIILEIIISKCIRVFETKVKSGETRDPSISLDSSLVLNVYPVCVFYSYAKQREGTDDNFCS